MPRRSSLGSPEGAAVLPEAESALASTRRAIADAVLGPSESELDSLGTISLASHQRHAAARLRQLIGRHRGAMLAEPVGTGKTFIALAVARGFPTRLVVAPAGLHDMWRESASRAQVAISVVSYESLRRGRAPLAGAELVIFDEAHRLRNPATRQYGVAAAMTEHAHVLLLSATPVQNRTADLAAELALFLGRAAWAMSAEDLATFVVRTRDVAASAPRMEGPYELILGSDDRTAEHIVALPSPVPAADEQTASALVTIGLLHQWTSSRAALVAALKRRLARGIGLLASLDAGRYPSRDDLSSWTARGDSVQLAFAELVSTALSAKAEPPHLRLRVEQHVEAIRRLLDRLRVGPNADLERVALLREIRSRHPGERIIAFAQYAETVEGLFRLLVRDGRVAALSAKGARMSTGRVSRNDVLSQFVPEAAANVAETVAVDLLLATDVLSEGLNLQEASVVVHLDLPWNPARMDQRVGRVRRLGSRHARVFAYIVQPSRAADRLLALEARLRRKLDAAQRTIGIAGRILPDRAEGARSSMPSVAERTARVRAALQSWQTVSGRTIGASVAAVQSARFGCLAAVRCRDGVRLIAGCESGVRTDARSLLNAVNTAAGHAVRCEPNQLTRANQLVGQWIEGVRVRDALDLRPAVEAQSRRRVLRRISRVLARAPRHCRPTLAPLVAAARAVAIASLPEGAERALDKVLTLDLPDEPWLRAVIALAEHHVEDPACGLDQATPQVIGLIVFQTVRFD